MGATHYSLPLSPKVDRGLFRSVKVEPEKIRVVIPVYNDWPGLKATLDSLLELDPRPGAITIANDNVDHDIPVWLKNYPVKIVDYNGNQGPAYARNQACGSYDSEFDWIYFTDCGCEHEKNLITYFINTGEQWGDSMVAICGSVSGKGLGKINRYMTEMNILNPPFESDSGSNGKKVPQAIITANALVYGPAFYELKGFSTDFREAGGEDLDLGIRLRNLGTLVYQSDATASHEFEEDREDFKKRFERYGRGNRLLEQKHNLPSLKSDVFTPPENEEFHGLAKLQNESLYRGYNQAIARASLPLSRPSKGKSK